MYTFKYSSAFTRDVKIYLRKGGSRKKLNRILCMLQYGKMLPKSLHDHQLHGKMRGIRELHVEDDWLLVYEKDGKKLKIMCIWLTTHKKLKQRQRKI